MEEKHFKDLEEQTIQDQLDKINTYIFEWIKDVLDLNIMRTIKLNTFLSNYFIYANYLPWLKFLFTRIPKLMPEDMDIPQMNFFLESSEKAFLLSLMVSMIYKGKNKLSPHLTDAKINDLHRSAPRINKFFFFNTIDPEIYEHKLTSLLKYSEGFRFINTLIPNMDFDPDFQPVLNCEALKQVYDISFISSYFDKGNFKPIKYPTEKDLLIKSSRLDQRKLTFDIDPNLTISKFMRETSNDLGVYVLGSYKQIDEIINVFTSYYSKKIPLRSQEIEGILLCFGELLKIVQGKLYCKFRYNYAIQKLKKKIPEHTILKFLEYFCLNKQDLTFPHNLQNFQPKNIIKEYNRFLCYCIYHISGIIFTGVFIIWRALIKYLEYLQTDDTFKQNVKGALLENWCYNKALEAGFTPEKLILLNPENKSPKKYKTMKQQIKDFPKIPIEIEAVFPEGYTQYPYFENDLMFRIDNYLFMFECKSTRSPIGEQPNLFTWIKRFMINITNLIKGANLLLYNLKNKYIDIDNLKDIDTIIPFQIQTEGILYDTMKVSTQGYLNILQEIQKNVKNDTFQDFVQKLSRIEII